MRTNPLQDSDTAKCINFCFTTYRVCLETLNHVQDHGMRFAQTELTSLLQLCADTCDLHARMEMAEADFAPQAAELCFQICNRTALECEKFPEEPIVIKCADICRKCAEHCRGMAGMTVRVKSSQMSARL
ncbi:four-helix bundle copper-binding protein [Bdellovibrio bacteriovorus]|uniref:four-helix bundle copper-binding protein n=1 Tax=Bdellovibrio bacteriovorus TaxID=959 RepID=UPI003AA7BB93